MTKRIQVGCGPHNLLEGWWNVDIRAFPGVDEVMDVAEPWPWQDEVEYVYGEHFLEHLSIGQAIKFLSHARSALRSSGRIRLSTPSLEWVLKTHFRFDDTGQPSKLLQTMAINRAFHGWGHQYLYSREMLGELLQRCGFDNVSFHDYGQSDVTDLVGLERHGGWRVEHGFPSVWIVEAERPEGEAPPMEEFEAFVHDSFIRYVNSGH